MNYTAPAFDLPYQEIPCVVAPDAVNAVDEIGYLLANADVRKAGLSARDHFVSHGQREGRLQWINQGRIARLREQKLGAVKFLRPPVDDAVPGESRNFISPEVKLEFGIPDSPPISANPYGGPFIEEIRNNPQRLCLDVGAGLRYAYTSNIVNTDIYPSICTDVVCVGEDLPFDDGQFDYALCLAVLEHTKRPWEVAREICRVLKPGGKILIDYPFLQAVHGYPHHYFNATPMGAISLFESSCEVISSEIGWHQHPIQTLWWLLALWSGGLSEADKAAFHSMTIGEILALPAHEHISRGYCSTLPQEAQRLIAAGSTLVLRKR